MTRTRFAVFALRRRIRSCFALGMVFALLAGTANGEDARKPRTDLYGDPLPPGAVARLGMCPFSSVVGGEDLVFSADGKHLLSADSDGQVRTWDAATGELLRRRRLAWNAEKGYELDTLVLSPDGSRLAAWDHQHVYVYDTATGRELGRLTAVATDSFILPLLRFSPDGKTLLVQRHLQLGALAETYLWDVRASNKRPRLTKLSVLPYRRISAAAFTPDGCRVVGIADTLRVWDTATGRQVKKSDEVFREVNYLLFSPDGKTLAVRAASPNRVDLLEAATLKKCGTLKPPANSKEWFLSDFTFSPDGRLLAVPYFLPEQDRGVLLWDVAGRKLQRRLSNLTCGGKLVFSRDGKTLACHGENHAVYLVDVATGQQRNPYPGHEKYVMALAVSADGRTIASGDGAGELRLWDAITSKPLRVWKAGEAMIYRCWFSPDGKRLISLDQKGILCAWDTATGKKRWRGEFQPSEIHDGSAEFSPDGKHLLLAIQPRGETTIHLSVWDAEMGKLLRRRSYEAVERAWTPPYVGSVWRLDQAAFAPDGERMFARQGIEDVLTGRILTALPGDIGSPAAFSSDGRCLAATIWQPQKGQPRSFTQNGLVLLETATGEEIFRWQTGAIDYVAFTPDVRAVVTANPDQVCVWDATTGQRWHQMRWPAISDESFTPSNPLCLTMLPGGQIATGMEEYGFVWDRAPSTWMIPKPAGDLDRKEFDSLWSDLAGTARKAYRAIGTLATVPAQTVPFLKNHLHLVVVDAKRIEKLLADLDSDSFATREAATRELSRRRYRAEPMLVRTIEGKPSLEMRRRLEAILAEPKRPPAESLRTLRAIALLERIGTPEARRILEKLSVGVAAPETREAKASLERLKRR